MRGATVTTVRPDLATPYVIDVKALSATTLRDYMQRIDRRLQEATTRGEVDILNHLWWKLYFELRAKGEQIDKSYPEKPETAA
jgi:hypothetical protein